MAADGGLYTALSLLPLVLMFLQVGFRRVFAFGIFSLFSGGFCLVSDMIPANCAYITAIMLNALCIILIASVDKLPKSLINLLIICFLFMLTNMCGYLLWRYDYEPYPYNIMIILLYLAVLYTMVRKDKGDAGINMGDDVVCSRSYMDVQSDSQKSTRL